MVAYTLYALLGDLSMTIDFEQIIEIINSSDREDVVLLNENYKRILDELPDGEERSRYLILRNCTAQRLIGLNNAN